MNKSGLLLLFGQHLLGGLAHSQDVVLLVIQNKVFILQDLELAREIDSLPKDLELDMELDRVSYPSPDHIELILPTDNIRHSCLKTSCY